MTLVILEVLLSLVVRLVLLVQPIQPGRLILAILETAGLHCAKCFLSVA